MSNYTFWTNAYKWGWVTAELLKGAVKTKSNPFGEISLEEYKTITGIDFEQA
ncbi:XkdX family protein [Rummeliibacillus sp. POC4]|uniref:XkdX family protein n=1 Tax=Rummeliibacillus sp. POC4 TaxID=2305899 RepID=UPI000E668FC1|nr:XkdX family protein [Rummeliibacillus sp. POC4]RIJ63589.1 XkdX family protein [Rummeliibacillus sp. POC4]